MAYGDIAVAGKGAQYFATNIDTLIAGDTHTYKAVLINLGVNDFGVITDQATWVGYMQTTVDAINAKWPNAVMYVTYPWKQGYDTTADNYAGWVDALIASRSFLVAGDDERVWLKGADNGATNTTDGVHYSTAGQSAAASQKAAVMGYLP